MLGSQDLVDGAPRAKAAPPAMGYPQRAQWHPRGMLPKRLRGRAERFLHQSRREADRALRSRRCQSGRTRWPLMSPGQHAQANDTETPPCPVRFGVERTTMSRSRPRSVRPREDQPLSCDAGKGGPVNSASIEKSMVSPTPMVVPGAGTPKEMPKSERLNAPCAENPTRACGSMFGTPA